MTERQVGSIDRPSAVPGSTLPAAERADRSTHRCRCHLARFHRVHGRPGCRRDRVVRWSFKVRDGCR
jgi:hypothetical protein